MVSSILFTTLATTAAAYWCPVTTDPSVCTTAAHPDCFVITECVPAYDLTCGPHRTVSDCTNCHSCEWSWADNMCVPNGQVERCNSLCNCRVPGSGCEQKVYCGELNAQQLGCGRRLGGADEVTLSDPANEPTAEDDRRRVVFHGCDGKWDSWSCQQNHACYWTGQTCKPKSELGCTQYGTASTCVGNVGVNNLNCVWQANQCIQSAPTANGCTLYTNQYQCSTGNDGTNGKSCSWNAATNECTAVTEASCADNTSHNTCVTGSGPHGRPCYWSNGQCKVIGNVNCGQISDEPTCDATLSCVWRQEYLQWKGFCLNKQY